MAAIQSDNRIRAEINRDWLIKYWHHDQPESHLVGAGQYHKVVGEKTAQKHFKRVLEYETDKYVFKVRNHLRIEFLQK